MVLIGILVKKITRRIVCHRKISLEKLAEIEGRVSYCRSRFKGRTGLIPQFYIEGLRSGSCQGRSY